jgi:hypothetical protein
MEEAILAAWLRTRRTPLGANDPFVRAATSMVLRSGGKWAKALRCRNKTWVIVLAARISPARWWGGSEFNKKR